MKKILVAYLISALGWLQPLHAGCGFWVGGSKPLFYHGEQAEKLIQFYLEKNVGGLIGPIFFKGVRMGRTHGGIAYVDMRDMEYENVWELYEIILAGAHRAGALKPGRETVALIEDWREDIERDLSTLREEWAAKATLETRAQIPRLLSSQLEPMDNVRGMNSRRGP